MPCCCVNTFNLCDTPVCGSLVLDILATAPSGSGEGNEYKLVLDYFQTQITIAEEQTEGQNIHFDISALNENFQFTGKVYDSSGNVVTLSEGAVVYDCIKFKTVVNVSV